MSRIRRGSTDLVPLIAPLAIVIIPVIVPGPLMSGAGFLLVKLGKVKAGNAMLRLGAGIQ